MTAPADVVVVTATVSTWIGQLCWRLANSVVLLMLLVLLFVTNKKMRGLKFMLQTRSRAVRARRRRDVNIFELRDI